jgi:hypothetical protein
LIACATSRAFADAPAYFDVIGAKRHQITSPELAGRLLISHARRSAYPE